MATFAIYIDKSQKRRDGDYPVSIRITQWRRHAYLSTGYYVCPEQMSKDFELKDQDLEIIILKKIKKCKDLIKDYLEDDVEDYSARELRDFLERKLGGTDIDFVSYDRGYLQAMKDAGRESTAQPIEKSLNGFIDFMKRDKINFSEITKKKLEEFGDYLKKERNIIRKNQNGKDQVYKLKALDDYGVGKYYIDLRGVYYAGMKKYNDEDTGEVLIKRNPFQKLEIKVRKKSKNINLTIEEIWKIFNMPDHEHKRANFARDIFMLSFMLVGINPVDLYCVDSYKKERISYNRKKTENRREDEAYISIKVEPAVKFLLNKYKDPTGKRVFNFYKMYSDSHVFGSNLNKGLKDVQKACGIEENLTMYVARNSWATIARNKLGVSVDDVALSLNHVDEEHKVTLGYIEKDFTLIDEANKKMIYLLFSQAQKEENFDVPEETH